MSIQIKIWENDLFAEIYALLCIFRKRSLLLSKMKNLVANLKKMETDFWSIFHR